MDARADVEIAIRGPQGYDLARRALEAMEREKVWPTALNYELWLHFVADPYSDLAEELQRLIDTGQPLTEDVTEELAARFLPKQKLNEQIRDAGDQLSRELESVSAAIAQAQKGAEAYGQTLSQASSELTDADAIQVKSVIFTLSGATRKIQADNKSLEIRLEESTAEVNRLKEHLEQVRRDATTDSLTNLANRKAFDEEAGRALSDADISGESVILALLDIDHFKNFNDNWGHQTGDQVIRFVASVIGRMAAPPRFAARYGGEEFAMIFPGETTAAVFDCLEEICTEISSRMLKRRSTNEDLGTITISAGMAERAAGEDLESVLDRADAALYASKHAGRNTTSRAKELAKAA
jgi:diguanylate cyclase